MVRKFQGRYLHKVDDKGRLIIPQKFRSKLGMEFHIAKDIYENCLTIYTLEEFEKADKELDSQPRFNRETQKLKRDFYSLSDECTMDKQGRVMIPSFLMEEVNISKEVYLLGAGDRIEIWDKDEFEGDSE